MKSQIKSVLASAIVHFANNLLPSVMANLYTNKKARFNYDIEETVEAGMVLEGWEVKSIKARHLSLEGAFVKFLENEAFLEGMHVPAWKHGEAKTKEDEYRTRKLLLSKREIKHLQEQMKKSRYAIVPLNIHTNQRGIIKVSLGIGKGRKKYDKRQKLKEKDLKKRIDQDRRGARW